MKGEIAKGVWKATGGFTKNFLTESLLEELPQGEVLDLSVKHAMGEDINLLDVYGIDTYKDMLSNPVKRETLAAVFFMSGITVVPDIMSVRKSKPSETHASDKTEGTHPDATAEEIDQLSASRALARTGKISPVHYGVDCTGFPGIRASRESDFRPRVRDELARLVGAGQENGIRKH